jgi:hypothetical protein
MEQTPIRLFTITYPGEHRMHILARGVVALISRNDTSTDARIECGGATLVLLGGSERIDSFVQKVVDAIRALAGIGGAVYQKPIVDAVYAWSGSAS